MDDNDDFTFCKVNGPVNVDVFEAQKVVPDVGGINLNDEPSECVEADKSIGVLSRNDVVTSTSPKEKTVGTLTFSVVSASSSKQSSDSAKKAASQEKESSPRESQEPNTMVKKPKPRAKVPFEKGYSQMDWLKLTRTHPDLAGLNGQSNQRLISLSEVKLHKTEDSMWTVLKGRVYNITPYMKFHPGGVDFLMKAVGKDCTALFNKYHAWVNAEFLLEKCLVGTLDDSQ